MTLVELLGHGGRLEVDFASEIIRGCCAAAIELGELRWSSPAIRIDWSPLPSHIEISSSRAVSLRPHDIRASGSFAYIAPETGIAPLSDERGWVFSLGAILYEMLAGRPLFRGQTDFDTLNAVDAARVPALDGIPPELEAVLLKALARDPADRYQSLDELSNALATTPASSPPYR